MTTYEPVSRARLAANWEAIAAALDAPRRGRLERFAVRAGLRPSTARLMAATPALRAAWFAATAVALLFAASAANNSTAAGTDRFTVFLTVAPLVPVLGVALSFGPGVDPLHELGLAAPLDGWRLLYLRTIVVTTTALVLGFAGVLLLPHPGLAAVGWLMPAFALGAATLALATRFGVRASALGVATAWVMIVTVAGVGSAGTAAPFTAPGQVGLAFTALAGAVIVVARRRVFDGAPGIHPGLDS